MKKLFLCIVLLPLAAWAQLKLSNLPPASVQTGTEIIPEYQAGNCLAVGACGVTLTQIASYANLVSGAVQVAGAPVAGDLVKFFAPGTITNGDLSGDCATSGSLVVLCSPIATGSTTARTLSARAADVYNLADYGAKCDGSTDDSVAINAAVAAIRAKSSPAGNFEWPIGRSGKLVAPSSRCKITSSINLTGFYGAGLYLDWGGTEIVCATSGTPCIDATGLGNSRLNNLTLYGSQTNSPNVGLAVGRITNNGVGADHNFFDHPTITGYFTFAAYYNNQSESTTIMGGWFINALASTSAYVTIFDGENHFNFQSAFTGQTYPQNTFLSFNENNCIGCLINSYGAGTVPVWIGGTGRISFAPNTFIAYSPSVTGTHEPAIIVYSGNSMSNPLIDMDAHVEDNSGFHMLNAVFLFAGAASITQNGLHYRDHFSEQSGPIFSRDTGGTYGTAVTSVTLNDADVQVTAQGGSAPSWWDTASAWTVNGAIFDESGTYAAPGTFYGTLCKGAVCNLATTTFVVQSGAATGAVTLGADVNATTLTANTRKLGRIVAPTYDNTSSPVGEFCADNDGTDNGLYIGWCNSGSLTSPTFVKFYTAATLNTTGILAGQFDKNQNLQIVGAIKTVGSNFTTSGCSVSAKSNGTIGGTFTLGANSCSVVVTLGGAAPIVGVTGYSCFSYDQTAPTVLISQTASSANTATFSIPAGAGATDVVRFGCPIAFN